MRNQIRIDVEKLAAPGTRKVGSQGHDQAVEYLKDRMGAAGLLFFTGQSYELPYQVESTQYTNLVGVLPGLRPTHDPFLLVAHYDTCEDQPGADDNAAAIAIWFNVLESLKMRQLQRDVIFLFPDAEEPPRFLTGHMGSTNFYETQLNRPIHAGLVLDLVGHDVPVTDLEELVFIFGAESHPELSETLLEAPLPQGLKNIATLNRYVGDLSDHHVLRKNGIPYLFLTCGRWEHYHQKSDTPENLNYEKMERVSRYLVSLLTLLDSKELGESKLDHDPVDMELKLLKRAVGPYLEHHGISMNDRNDIQKFVMNWLKQHQL